MATLSEKDVKNLSSAILITATHRYLNDAEFYARVSKAARIAGVSYENDNEDELTDRDITMLQAGAVVALYINDLEVT